MNTTIYQQDTFSVRKYLTPLSFLMVINTLILGMWFLTITQPMIRMQDPLAHLFIFLHVSLLSLSGSIAMTSYYIGRYTPCHFYRIHTICSSIIFLFSSVLSFFTIFTDTIVISRDTLLITSLSKFYTLTGFINICLIILFATALLLGIYNLQRQYKIRSIIL